MASSSRAAGALLVAFLAAVAFAPPAGLLSGCAHASAARAEPPRAASARAATAPPGALDPSEEITPEELASIPEPLPAAARPASPAKPASKAPDKPPEPRSPGGELTTPPSPATTPPPPSSSIPEPAPPVIGGSWIWRVQILATPDRALAERVAQEAAERLGTTSRVDTEAPLHKVRLGGFGSEAGAQALKERAVEMGYPGAFRVKIRVAATDG